MTRVIRILLVSLLATLGASPAMAYLADPLVPVACGAIADCATERSADGGARRGDDM